MDSSTRLRILLADRSDPEVERDDRQAGERGDDLGRLARALRDAGHEVVYLGAVGSDEAVEAIAVQEDVDAICQWDGNSMGVTGADDGARTAIESLLET